MKRFLKTINLYFISIQIELLYLLGKLHNEQCNAFGGINRDGDARICAKWRWHTDSHVFDDYCWLDYPKITKYVLAENHQHFVHWCRISGFSPEDPHVQYVASPKTIRGINPRLSEFIFYETWRNHPQSDVFNAIVTMTMARRPGKKDIHA